MHNLFSFNCIQISLVNKTFINMRMSPLWLVVLKIHQGKFIDIDFRCYIYQLYYYLYKK